MSARGSRADLVAAIKTARNVMRKDAGLSGDLDRTPQFSWLLSLKALDDLERRREVIDDEHRPTIAEPYRWRDWAADPVEGRTGEELIAFVNGDLLPHLRGLSGRGGGDPRDTVAAIFKETQNRMLSGYLLREVVDVVDRIDFTSSDDVHTMAHLYESMLREMRDAAGDSGEFYTPRPLIRFIVQQVDPRPGDSVLDPAAGTGGFMVEALEHVRVQLDTGDQWRELQRDVRGVEKKPLPFLLGTMNLLLHDVESPAISRDNALATPLRQIAKRDRVDAIVTNPPFGGEEEKGIQAGFPQATRTSETALLFLQTIQRLLNEDGRCGMVVPNGVLFGDGTAARVKQKLLAGFDLHTVVRLPPGVFAPYTPIPTNLMFFDRTGPTKEVWYYELPPPEGRKGYSKTLPLRFEELDDCREWWGGRRRAGRVEGGRAWRVPIAHIQAERFNLDRRNPHRAAGLEHRPPSELIAELLEVEGRVRAGLEEIAEELSR